MWLLAVLACGTVAPPAGPSARERFVADPPPRTPPDGERYLGGTPWGDPLPFEPVAWRAPVRSRPSGDSDLHVVALEGGRWAIGDRDAWSVWDPARGLVAEATGDGWPGPDGAWLLGDGQGVVRLDPTPVAGTRVGWVWRERGPYEYAWSEAGAVRSRGVPRDAARPPVAVVRAPAAKSAVSAADHLVLRTPDGEDTRLDGCVDPEDVWWAPGGGFLACRGDGAIHVHPAAGGASWSAPEGLGPGAIASLSAEGRVLAHIVDEGPCVHHADGRTWAKPGIQARGAVVTDDGSLVVAVGFGSAVLDAATGARLDPPRSSTRPSGWTVGPRGEVATITSLGELRAWDAAGESLGTRMLEPRPLRGGIVGGSMNWGRHLDWTAQGVCASRHGRFVCVDPWDDWRVTLERENTGLVTGVGSHVVSCGPLAVDGVPIPGLRCSARAPKISRDPRFVEVLRDGERRPLYLDVDTLDVATALPAPAPAPEVTRSRSGGVRVVDPPGGIVEPPPAPLPRSPTRDAEIPLAAHLGDAPPSWAGAGWADPDTLSVELERQEIRFRRTDGSLGRLVVEGASQVAQSPGYLAVRTRDAVLLASLTDGSVRSVYVGNERFEAGAVRGGGLAFSPDGSRLAAVGPGASRVWSVPGLDELARGSSVAHVGASPEGRWAVVTRRDAAVLLVDLAAGTVTPVDGLRASGLTLAFPWAADGASPARLDDTGGVVASRVLPWRQPPGLLLDDDGRVEVAWNGRRFTIDDDGRLADVGGHTTDYGWDVLLPGATWAIPGRSGVAPDVRACEPAAALACSAVPAGAPIPASAEGIHVVRPSPDGRWLVGVAAERRIVLRGPGGRSHALGVAADFAWADARTLVVERDGVREIWRDGVREEVGPAGPRGGALAAGGDRVVRATERALFVTALTGGTPSCVLPVDGRSAVVVSPAGRFAAWLAADGLWRVDLAECRVVQRPPELSPPVR